MLVFMVFNSIGYLLKNIKSIFGGQRVWSGGKAQNTFQTAVPSDGLLVVT
ncbi:MULTISPECIES: hypothetical protein [unclassified Pseudomonas]|nr:MULTISPECIES: hypothetical protein [unclassified Pseudomonas]